MLKILHISPQPKEVARKRQQQGMDVGELLTGHFRSWMQSLTLETIFTEDRVPSREELKAADGVVISGSVLSVYQENLPWMEELQQLIRAALAEHVPMLGICFGHQAISQALGGNVALGKDGKEAGVIRVSRSEKEYQDPLFDQVPHEFHASSVHADAVVRLPQTPGFEVRVLAASRKYIQSLAIGDNVRTAQFHPEFDTRTLDLLLESEFHPDEIELDQAVDRDKVVDTGRQILRNFLMYFVQRRRAEISARQKKVL